MSGEPEAPVVESDTPTGEEEEQTFPVSTDELSSLRADLKTAYPNDYESLSDSYILSVASKPYSKDPTVRRPLEYTLEKLTDVLKWREENAVGMEDMLKMAESGSGGTDEELAKAKAIAESLNYGFMYWHGLDKEGRPILWIRTNRMPWYPDVTAQINALILVADAGIKLMPSGITDFVVLSDSNSPPPPNPQFMINLLSALAKGYPDRLAFLISCLVGSIIQFVMKILTPLMPGRLASKINLIGQEDCNETLGKVLMNGESDIPMFLGGPCDHDDLYPAGGSYPEKVVKFDYDGMLERLQKDVQKFTEKK